MCGRFELKADPEYLEKIYNKNKKRLNPEYDTLIVLKKENIAPTDKIMVITMEGGEYKLKIMKWSIKSKVLDTAKKGDVNLFGTDPYIDKDIFNSRIETLKASSEWKKLIYNCKCLIPMTAFYEWKPAKGKKQPYRIFIENEGLFFVAGIFKPLDLKNETGVSIITCEPNKFMKPLHNRMPVLFDFKLADEYLNTSDENVFNLCEPLDDKVKMNLEEVKLG